MTRRTLRSLVLAWLSLSAALAHGTPAPVVNACEQADISTVGWKRIKAGAWSVLLPPMFKPGRTISGECCGTDTWASGSDVLYVGYGHWGRDSFPIVDLSSSAYSECAVVIDGERTLLMTRREGKSYSVTAWFMDMEKAASPLQPPPAMTFYFSSDGDGPESQRLFLAAFRTIKISEPEYARKGHRGERMSFQESYDCGPDDIDIHVDRWWDASRSPARNAEAALRKELRDYVTISEAEQAFLSRNVSLPGYSGSGTLSCPKELRVHWDQESAFLLLRLDSMNPDERGVTMRLAPREWLKLLDKR